ncbi:unnamed protein product [Heligmosomoides polygyrus]|uniref:Uncharacterized protein n=1 Tax=Heligmosomoides polygyrus TaxID=6339 RepID=A0A183FH00_HELPZ|nr:unnamed protein product [Heligmosomoides polygyrus]
MSLRRRAESTCHNGENLKSSKCRRLSLGQRTRPPSGDLFSGLRLSTVHGPSTCRLYKRLARGRRGVATPGLPYFIKADNFDNTDHLPSPLLLQMRK